jgi:hypothetical protein
LADEVGVLESVKGGARITGTEEEELGFVPGSLESS